METRRPTDAYLETLTDNTVNYIVKLEAEIKRLQAAIKPFAQAFREGPRDQPWNATVNRPTYLDWKRAAEAGGK